MRSVGRYTRAWLACGLQLCPCHLRHAVHSRGTSATCFRHALCALRSCSIPSLLQFVQEVNSTTEELQLDLQLSTCSLLYTTMLMQVSELLSNLENGACLCSHALGRLFCCVWPIADCLAAVRPVSYRLLSHIAGRIACWLCNCGILGLPHLCCLVQGANCARLLNTEVGRQVHLIRGPVFGKCPTRVLQMSCTCFAIVLWLSLASMQYTVEYISKASVW